MNSHGVLIGKLISLLIVSATNRLLVVKYDLDGASCSNTWFSGRGCSVDLESTTELEWAIFGALFHTSAYNATNVANVQAARPESRLKADEVADTRCYFTPFDDKPSFLIYKLNDHSARSPASNWFAVNLAAGLAFGLAFSQRLGNASFKHLVTVEHSINFDVSQTVKWISCLAWLFFLSAERSHDYFQVDLMHHSGLSKIRMTHFNRIENSIHLIGLWEKLNLWNFLQ